MIPNALNRTVARVQQAQRAPLPQLAWLQRGAPVVSPSPAATTPSTKPQQKSKKEVSCPPSKTSQECKKHALRRVLQKIVTAASIQLRKEAAISEAKSSELLVKILGAPLELVLRECEKEAAVLCSCTCHVPIRATKPKSASKRKTVSECEPEKKHGPQSPLSKKQRLPLVAEGVGVGIGKGTDADISIPKCDLAVDLNELGGDGDGDGDEDGE